MNPDETLLFGLIVGLILAGLFWLAYDNWRDGSKLVKRPSQVAKENKERMDKAQKEAAKGRQKQSSAALIFFLLLFAVVVVLLYAMGVLPGL